MQQVTDKADRLLLRALQDNARLTSGELAYTRAGNFTRSAEGTLVTAQGYPLNPAITIPEGASAISISQSQLALDKNKLTLNLQKQELQKQMQKLQFQREIDQIRKKIEQLG